MKLFQRFEVRMAFCLLFLGLFAPVSALTQSVDGTLIRRGGSSYNIVAKPGVHEIKVYVKPVDGPLPSTLVVQVKRKNKIIERISVKLDQSDPDHFHYSGIVPAGVFVSGGITFDIEF